MNTNSLTQTFPELLDGGQLTKVSLELPVTTTEKQWQEIGLQLGRLESSSLWWIGDWWAFGEHAYGERKALVESEDWAGPAFETCSAAGKVSRAFKNGRRRRLSLPWNHHKEVAWLPEREADRLLDWCEETIKSKGKPHTIRELREEVKKVKAYLAQGWNASQLERKAQVEKGLSVLASNQPATNGLPVDNALITWADSQGLLVPIDRTREGAFDRPSGLSAFPFCG
jgi:hypothetical protein